MRMLLQRDEQKIGVGKHRESIPGHSSSYRKLTPESEPLPNDFVALKSSRSAVELLAVKNMVSRSRDGSWRACVKFFPHTRLEKQHSIQFIGAICQPSTPKCQEHPSRATRTPGRGDPAMEKGTASKPLGTFRIQDQLQLDVVHMPTRSWDTRVSSGSSNTRHSHPIELARSIAIANVRANVRDVYTL